ncbi:MAG: PadR family transcriptional regulator, partial [Gemmatimonadota bacterium]|nr:PadR family transcriptional regulator [Gemmatimonadota bacterium]
QTSGSFFVLVALSKGPSHGLGIAEDVAAFTEGQVLLGPGTLYRCLRELAEAGSIERVDINEGPDVRHRKYYRLTPAGEAEAVCTLRGLTRLTEVGRARLGAPLTQGA